jgi:hypothetical protein
MIERLKNWIRKPSPVTREVAPASAPAVQMDSACIPSAIAGPARVDVLWGELDALLSPGPAARNAEAKIPLPVVPAPEPKMALVALDTDYDNISLPPRSPEMIRRLIDAGETVEQRTRRMHNDIARFRSQRGL